MIGAAIRTRLLESYAVRQLLVVNGNARIYPLRTPQGLPANIMPCLVYQVVSEVTAYGLAHVGPLAARLQLTAWAINYDVCRDLAQKVRLAIEGFEGQRAGETINGVFHRGGRDLPFEQDLDAQVYGHTQDFEVSYKAALAA